MVAQRGVTQQRMAQKVDLAPVQSGLDGLVKELVRRAGEESMRRFEIVPQTQCHLGVPIFEFLSPPDGFETVCSGRGVNRQVQISSFTFLPNEGHTFAGYQRRGPSPSQSPPLSRVDVGCESTVERSW